MFSLRRILPATLIGAALACSSSRTATVPGTEGYGTVRVENQNIHDMRIYLRPAGGGGRYRLGTANALETTTLRIPSTMLAGISELVFEVTPLGGGSEFSERVTVHEGDEVVLRISP